MLLFALTPWILLNICVASAANSLDNVETLILNASLGGFDSERLRSALDSSKTAGSISRRSTGSDAFLPGAGSSGGVNSLAPQQEYDQGRR
jgi:hypothetical protein